MRDQHIHFVTGKLAEHALRETVAALQTRLEFHATMEVLPITVAALMTTDWVARHWTVPNHADLILIPGYCRGDLEHLQRQTSSPVALGPKDLRGLPEYFGQTPDRTGYGEYELEILAEINHAGRLPRAELVAVAQRLVRDGADVIDLGCTPGEVWSDIGAAVQELTHHGIRVSVDSFDPEEVTQAVNSGAELVLSVNRTNRHLAADWNCEVVAIPDRPSDWESLIETVAYLDEQSVPYRIDPILEPIGCGFAPSLGRYLRARAEFPQAHIMMGIGNLTELTDVDSAGVNVVLLGFCAELQIQSVLTTQVIPWAQTSVRECDLGRRLVHFAVTRQIVPKHVDPQLVMLRDPKRYSYGQERLDQLAEQIRDHNYRLFAEEDALHLISRQMHLTDTDPFDLFARLLATEPKNLDLSHAFYLGYELSKALTALTLGKEYRQDQALDWGFLTREEVHRGRSQ